MTEMSIAFSEEIKQRLERHLAFMQEAMQRECRLTIYWQNEIYKDNEEVLPPGWHVQALPFSADSGFSFIVNGLEFHCGADDAEEIGVIEGKRIVLVGEVAMLVGESA